MANANEAVTNQVKADKKAAKKKGKTDTNTPTVAQTTATTSATSDIKSRLETLEQLKKDKLITDGEYQQKKNEILNSL
jgi:hypothetical protein